jgi:glycosyltransferase involved in cell wall biosynthesis
VKFAIISHGSTNDSRNFSGIPWNITQELRRQGHTVEAFQAEPAEWARSWAHIKHLFSLKFTAQPHHVEADSGILHTRSMHVAKQIRKFAPDAVLCVGFPEAAVALPKSWPLYVWMDALYPSVRRLYPYFHTYYSESDARGLQRMEMKVMRRCRKIWLSSDWAAEEAKQDFPATAPQIGVQSFGANLTEAPNSAEVEKFILSRNIAEPTLLFLANEWERKGGDWAIETVKRLRTQGCYAKLAVVGITERAAAATSVPWLDWVGRLDKNRPDEAKRLGQYLSESAFLLLPTVADCTPIVCHEAAAYGLPVLATNVGGLPSTVDSGVTGMLWPVAKFAEEAPTWMAAVLTDRQRYEQMARAARRRYEQSGNWAVNVRAVATAIAQDLGRN